MTGYFDGKELKESVRYQGDEFDKYKNMMYFDLFELIRKQNNFS